MLSRWVRTWDSKILRPLLRLLIRCGITPNMLTLAGIMATAGSGVIIGTGHLRSGVLVLLLGALCDGMDGEMARLLKQNTRFGAFFDSMADHLGDFALHSGLLYYYLRIGLQTEVILIFVALFGSMFGSQVRSRAEMTMGIDTSRIGFFTRFERLLVLMLGLVLNQVTVALWILAIFNNVSAMQRVVYVLRITRLAGRQIPPAQ
jgi:CDP-diacylglycerol---glycerol-3-phosphate 3-phosphatidyltransferase